MYLSPFTIVSAMEVDRKNHDKKTMLDEDGKYPKWMNQRNIKKQKVKNTALKKKQKNQQKPGKKKVGKKIKW